jgi:hypothetical protein
MTRKLKIRLAVAGVATYAAVLATIMIVGHVNPYADVIGPMVDFIVGAL